MPSRASKRKVLDELEETNSLAASIVAQATSQFDTKFKPNPVALVPDSAQQFPPKNAAAVALGRLGASKGGKARAAALTKKRRKEIARKAASARWVKKKPDSD